MGIIDDYCDGKIDLDEVMDSINTLDDNLRNQLTKDILFLVLTLLDDTDSVGFQYGEVDEAIANDHNDLLQDFCNDVKILV